MSFWRRILDTIARNPISFFAVICVAVIAALLWFMADRMIAVLETPNWCANAIQAERISPQNFGGGLSNCVELFKIQLSAVATGFHITVGGFVFSLIVLIVVVVAGARASLKLSQEGIEGDVSRDPVSAAEHVVAGAEEAAEEVTEGRTS